MIPRSRSPWSESAPQYNSRTRTNGCVARISSTVGDCEYDYRASSVTNYLVSVADADADADADGDGDANGGTFERKPLLHRQRQRRRLRQQQQQQQPVEGNDDAVFSSDSEWEWEWEWEWESHCDYDHDHRYRRIVIDENEGEGFTKTDAAAVSVDASAGDENVATDHRYNRGVGAGAGAGAGTSTSTSTSSFSPATFYGAGSEMASNTLTTASTERGGGGGGHRVIYCVHGKPEGCCARVLSESNSSNGSSAVLPSPPITLFEDHCHQSRETKVDRNARTKLIVASVLCLVFMIAEVVGGVLSSSLAIATDAAHLLTDFGSFMISLFALWVGSRPATRSMPFGWYRAEVLGALTSVLMIWVVTGVLLYVAVERVLNQQFEIEAQVMLITSAFGVCVNIVMALTLHQHHHHHGHSHSHDRDHAHRHRAKDEENIRAAVDDDEDSGGGGGGSHRNEQNINVRAAYIHVIGDFIQSFGVLLASVIIYYKPEWKIVDPICTFGFSVLVLFTTFAILRDTMIVLMEGIPKGIDFCDVLNTFLSIDGVLKVHNLRIWALSLDKMALAAHLAVRPGVNTATILKVASRRIHQKFNFFEMTLQIEEFQEQMTNCKQCQDPLT